MTYQESAEPLTFKQKVKRVAIVSSYIIVFVAGGVAIPRAIAGYDMLIAPFFEKEAYVAPLSEFDTKVSAYAKTEKHQTFCRNVAEYVISAELAGQYSAKSDEKGNYINTKINILNGGISEETVAETIHLETEQGRRK
jgi:hypothetical protein